MVFNQNIKDHLLLLFKSNKNQFTLKYHKSDYFCIIIYTKYYFDNNKFIKRF
jgi:hypothetical protein